jgi:hypothetical protein
MIYSSSATSESRFQSLSSCAFGLIKALLYPHSARCGQSFRLVCRRRHLPADFEAYRFVFPSIIQSSARCSTNSSPSFQPLSRSFESTQGIPSRTACLKGRA